MGFAVYVFSGFKVWALGFREKRCGGLGFWSCFWLLLGLYGLHCRGLNK